MDRSSFDLMLWFVKNYLKDEVTTILDVGSMDVNGTYKSAFTNPKWAYKGLDIEAGKNVDIVAASPYCYPTSDWDVVISGQTGEHVEDIYAWADELIRVVKPGGLLYVAIPAAWNEHRYPVDCWRILPDGMRWLFVKRTKKVEELFIGSYYERFSDWTMGSTYAVFKKL
jgi:SAM-dependent methyltransferase